MWLYLAGRGAGKTRAGAEWVRDQVESGRARRVALVARSVPDVRDVVVEGESGLLRIGDPARRPTWEPSKRRLTWPNGAIATTYSADEPDQLRGPQHDAAWCDELASWRRPEAWSNLMLGLRLGDDPRCVVTTTPRPTKEIRALVASPLTHVTRGTTYDNRENLAPAFLDQIVHQYEGTRLGRQELHAEILEDVAGALWTRAELDAALVREAPAGLERIVVGVDPAVSAHAGSDETGIVVVGVTATGDAYVLEDASMRGSPSEWAARVVRVFRRHAADLIVAEVNMGGDLVEHTLRAYDRALPIRKVTATRGKLVRAEPVASLYEQGRVHHVGALPELEDQMCSWDPSDTRGPSPDRVDALVWALWELVVSRGTDREEPKAAELAADPYERAELERWDRQQRAPYFERMLPE